MWLDVDVDVNLIELTSQFSGAYPAFLVSGAYPAFLVTYALH